MSELCLCYHCMEAYDKDYGICPFCGCPYNPKAAEPFHLQPGTVLQNKYIIGKALDYGGFSVTYIGFDMTLQMKVTLKEYLPSEYAVRVPGQKKVTVSHEEDSDIYMNGINKFVKEAQRIAALENIEGVVKVFDAFTENNTAYIVTEFLEGETLAAKLEKCGKIEPEKAFQMLMPLLNSLEKIHEAGILHRDISPDNIFYTKSDTIKLVNFCSAREMPKGRSRSLSIFINQGYTPPEQYTTDGHQDTWTDVYALAATIYKVITGITPPDSLKRKMKDTLKHPSQTGIKISKSAENALLNAMNLRIQDRTKTIGEFQKQLYSTQKVKHTRNKKTHYTDGIPKWIKMMGIFAAVIIVILTGVMISGVFERDAYTMGSYEIPEGKTIVPSLVNKSFEQAKQKAEEYHLKIMTNNAQYSDDVPKNRVYEQNIDIGSIVDENTLIYVTVSAGPKYVSLPQIHGLPKEKALELLGNDFEIETEETESIYAKNLVCGESLDNSRTYRSGTKITLQIAKGKQIDQNTKVTVPNFMDKKLFAAERLAEKNNLTITIQYEPKSDIEAGTVFRQAYSSGTKLNKWSEITLTVSTNENMEKTVVPYLIGKSLENASKDLQAAHLMYQITEREYSDEIESGHIISQSIESDQLADINTSIEIVVSKGPQNNNENSVSQDFQNKNENFISQFFTQDSQIIDEITVQSVEILSLPNKTTIYPEQEFDLTGLRARALLSDGSFTEMTATGVYGRLLSGGSVGATITSDPHYDWRIFGSKSYADMPGKVTFTVQCEDKSTTFDITITEVYLESIAVTHLPNKTVFYRTPILSDDYRKLGFDITGLEVTAYLSDGNSYPLEIHPPKSSDFRYHITTYSWLNDYECSFDIPKMSETGTSPVYIHYYGKTASYNIEILDCSVTSLEIVHLPYQTTYHTNEEFRYSGLDVIAYYNDGLSTKFPFIYYADGTMEENGWSGLEWDVSCEADFGDKPGTYPVTITCEDKSVTFNFTVIESPDS